MLTPLHLVIGQVAKHTLLQMTAEGTGKGKVISSQRMEELSGTIPLALLPRECITKKLNFTKKFKITLGNKADWSDSALELLLRDSSIRWYTDGSKTSEGIGAGVAGPRAKLSIPMGRFPSIFQAEVFAISRCVELNLHRGYRNERIAILSDSQAAFGAISSYEVKSLLVQECIDRLNSLAECNQVHLIWVPGYKGIAGNELADELARAAASINMVGPEPFIAVGRHTIKEQFRKDAAMGREIHWQQLPGLRHAKLLMKGYNLKRFKLIINLPRDKVRLLVVKYKIKNEKSSAR
uniref:RNase H type-1 domain-containing protein n=1 Tax=Bactrocera latifrons TaxID=174628 RepID=A0A0K8UJZ2_BACLA